MGIIRAACVCEGMHLPCLCRLYIAIARLRKPSWALAQQMDVVLAKKHDNAFGNLCPAQVHGQVLAGWSLHQLFQAAQQAGVGSVGQPSTADTLRRLDTFLAANWQAYLEFAESMVQQVRSAQLSPAQRRAQPCARRRALPSIL